ncbi:hypothetical protein QBC33DRAFT_542636 [Phialemonium atrogriseum]|uniref:Mitochondrial intermembrane space import and assembly protein 40 n=1 Tax=Phialemonium atrogriseum TaxID=1093897 RepID=A0AAJ0FFS5_9PEZI|nr:uncharacterized protein QBC33DRAFT_542636 [Phialemonium atrogriseum]KAK1765837.1 hypothetical protein QBC33DRAFT_542636 [Phialemonium atrogriseum]
MYRAALRSSPRALRNIRQSNLSAAPRRFLTTSPSGKRRTWKGAAARWGTAIAAVYWYSTSPIFADETAPRTGPPPPQFSDSDLPTVDAVIEEKRRQTRAAAPPPPEPQSTQQTAASPLDESEPGQQSPEALEEEADQQGAFNPETGEINWDCPCLGGMAHGPCGEEFKSAFSCFVHSTEEPKGMDCIEKFQHMRDCFRQYPEVYGAELEDDDEDNNDEEIAPPAAGAEASGAGDVLPEPSKPQPAETSPKAEESTPPTQDSADGAQPVQNSRDAKQEAEETIPKKAVDATAANPGKEQS